MKDLQQQGNKRDGVNQFNSNKLLTNPPTEVNMCALALEAHTGRSQVFTSFSLAGLVVLVICEELVFFFFPTGDVLVWGEGLGKESTLKCQLKRLILICQKCP